jgi:hypothetical protein
MALSLLSLSIFWQPLNGHSEFSALDAKGRTGSAPMERSTLPQAVSGIEGLRVTEVVEAQ